MLLQVEDLTGNHHTCWTLTVGAQFTDLMSFKAPEQPKEASEAALTGCFEILTESSGDKFIRMSCFTFTF